MHCATNSRSANRDGSTSDLCTTCGICTHPAARLTTRQTTAFGARGAALWLLLLGAAYAVLVVTHWNAGYLDFGDGNYMYVSWRMAGGAVLYRDLMAPQPPMHLWIGSLLARVGMLFGHPLWAFRSFSLILHLLSMVAVYFAAVRVTGGNDDRALRLCRGAGITAAAVYLVLPIGFWWCLGYQSEPLEMFLMIWSFTLFISLSRRWMPLAGLLQGLAPLTNMTAAPYTLFNIGWLAVRKRNLVLRYAVPCVGIIAVVTVGMQLFTGHYLENVITNQVGSYPKDGFLPYAWGKIVREGMKVIDLEGGFVVICLLGLLRYAARGCRHVREYVTFYSFFALCSILYVTKGGTVDYIVTIGEPFVAIFCGYSAFHFTRRYSRTLCRLPGWRDLTPVATLLCAAMLVVVVTATGLAHSWATLKQRTYELDEFETGRIVADIQRNSRPDGLVFAPPYYAFLAQRRIAEDYAELLLWTLKYRNEKEAGVKGPGIEIVERLAQLLRDKRIDYVVLDMNQPGRLPELRAAIDEAYQPLRRDEFRTLNTSLRFYVPK